MMTQDLYARTRRALNEKYRIKSIIAAGSSAAIFLAHDRKHARPLAIKVLRDRTPGGMSSSRFMREIEVVASIRHPNLLPLYDSGTRDGLRFFVMPFVEGGSLRARLDREGMLPMDDAIRIAREVADGLAAAHERGVVHRDVKPENILIDGGHAVVADFGIASSWITEGGKAEADIGSGLGTLSYASPEQSEVGRRLDGRSDVYSLGCVLYEMVTGKPPFHGLSARAVVAKKATGPIPSVRKIRPAVPEELARVIGTALAPLAADRQYSMVELAKQLDGLRFTQHRNRRLPNRWFLAGVGVAVLAILGLLPLATSSGNGVVLDPTNLAVLGLSPATNDPRAEIFARALTDRLTDGLGSIDALRVVGRPGTAPFAESGLPFDSVATLLRVGTLVSGSVETYADSVRVRVELLSGESGEQLAVDVFEVPFPDRLGLVNAITDTVFARLRRRLGPLVRSRRYAQETLSIAAFDAVQLADVHYLEFEALLAAGDVAASEVALRAADSILLAAERADPAWAVPIIERGWLAQSFLKLLAASGLDDGTRLEIVQSGILHAERALRIAPRHPEALELRGKYRFDLWSLLGEHGTKPDTLLRSAEADLRAALGGNPRRARVLKTLSELFSSSGRREPAILYAERAYQEDPYLENIHIILLRLFEYSFELERDSDAKRWCEEGSRRFPDEAPWFHCRLRLLALSSVDPPSIETAWELRRRTLRRTPPALRSLISANLDLHVAAVVAREGDADSALAVLAGVDALEFRDANLALLKAVVFARAGQPRRAESIVNALAAEQPQMLQSRAFLAYQSSLSGPGARETPVHRPDDL